MQCAQTNLQLYNQLRKKGLSLDDLVLVHRAYELSTTLYSGYIQGDGKPFIAHGVGVASILAELGQPAAILAVGVLHNVYGNGDFGDARGPGPTIARRRLVRDAVGEHVEQLLVRFSQLRVQWWPIARTLEALPRLNDTERQLVMVDLVDYLEKYVDLGVLYYGRVGRPVLYVERIESEVVAIASALGEVRLAEMLTSAFAEVAAARSEVPSELHPSDGRLHLELFVPRSCRRKVVPRMSNEIRRLRDRVQLRTRLRAWLRGLSGASSPRDHA